MPQRPMKSNEQRIEEIEKALLMFALLASNEAISPDEKAVIQSQFAIVMDSIRSRHV